MKKKGYTRSSLQIGGPIQKPIAATSPQRAGMVGLWPVCLCISVGLAILYVPWLTPAMGGITPTVAKAGILVLFTVFVWAFGIFPEPVGTLILFLFAVFFSVTTPTVIFSGFQSPAWWLVFGGSITGIAVKTTGLGDRLARLLFLKFAGSYRDYVIGVACAAVGLAFVMPSTTGRILVLIPTVLALADRLGLQEGRNGRAGLVMTAAAASYMPPTAILPANIPNDVLLGAADAMHHVKLDYVNYLLLHFPILGILKTIAIVYVVCRLFPESEKLEPITQPKFEKMPKEAKLLSMILIASLGFFATDFLHHISPAWISLAAGVVCLLPLAGVVPTKKLNENMHITPLIYVAGFLGLGALIVASGLGALVSEELLKIVGMNPTHQAFNFLGLAGMFAIIGLITTLPGLPAILTPLAQHFANASGLPLYTVLMLQVPVFSTVFLPYQAPPMMIAMHLGGIPLRDGVRFCLVLAALTVVVLLPIDYVWWRCLDLI